MSQPASEKSGHWYLITGLVLGLLLGMFYSLVIAPAEFIDVTPSMLYDELKDEYRGVVALAYQSDGDIGRAQARLALLEDEDPVAALQEQSQRILKAGGSRLTSQALLSLADALQKAPSKSPELTAEPDATGEVPTGGATADEQPDRQISATQEIGQVLQTPTVEPLLTETPEPVKDLQSSESPAPSPTPSSSKDMPYVLQDRQELCDSDGQAGLLQIEVEDQEGQPVAGAQITITWDDGEEFFFTGLYPQVSLGYADYEMEPGVEYRLKVGDGGEIVNDIQIPTCEGGSGAYDGGLYLSFSP